MAFQLCSQFNTPHLIPSLHLFSFFISSSFSSLSVSTTQMHSSAALISAADVLQMAIFFRTQGSLLLLAKWLQGLLTIELCWALSLSTQPALPQALFPPPPVSSRKPSLPCAVFPSHELHQLNGDIRRKVEEPKPSGSSPLGWLATAFRVATVSPHLPFPSSLPVHSLSSPPQFLPLASPQKEDLSLKTVSSWQLL